MPSHKARIVKSIETLVKEVADINELAKRQRQDADSQHANAHQLESIGAALDVGTATLEAKLEKL